MPKKIFDDTVELCLVYTCENHNNLDLVYLVDTFNLKITNALLNIAIHDDHPHLLKLLLGLYKGEINKRDILTHCIASSSVDVLRYMAENYDMKDVINTAMFSAPRTAGLYFCRVMSNYATVKWVDQAFYYACYENRPIEIISWLLDLGANPNAFDISSMLFSNRPQSDRIISLIRSRGFPLNEPERKPFMRRQLTDF